MTDHEKIEWLISEADTLISHSATFFVPAFQYWFSEAERFLIKRFGQDSFEYKKLKDTRFRPSVYVNDADIVKKCKEGLTTTKLIFQSYLKEMNEESTVMAITRQVFCFDKVFIVHGHDGELKQSVARVIEKQGIEAVILSEQVNRGRTIIEKFEENADVGGAICLFTADDLGRAKSATDDQLRARQNVVFESGYFMGKLGRKHVVFLADSNVEMPSDLSGVVYTSTGNWQFELLKELGAMGYAVDLNKLL